MYVMSGMERKLPNFLVPPLSRIILFVGLRPMHLMTSPILAPSTSPSLPSQKSNRSKTSRTSVQTNNRRFKQPPYYELIHDIHHKRLRLKTDGRNNDDGWWKWFMIMRPRLLDVRHFCYKMGEVIEKITYGQRFHIEALPSCFCLNGLCRPRKLKARSHCKPLPLSSPYGQRH